MSIKKRRYNIEKLRYIYSTGGIQALLDDFSGADVHQFEDAKSSYIFETLINSDDTKHSDIILILNKK